MSEKEALLISACLLGVECKYSGGHNAMAAEKIAALREKYRLIPVCPETAGVCRPRAIRANGAAERS